jgi:hypothetical protein
MRSGCQPAAGTTITLFIRLVILLPFAFVVSRGPTCTELEELVPGCFMDATVFASDMRAFFTK